MYELINTNYYNIHQYDITQISAVNLQNKITCLKTDKFLNFKNLYNVYNTKNLLYIECNVFDDCDNLTNFDFSESIEYIGHNAFDSTNINILHVPPKIKILHDEVFINCKNLEKIIFHKNTQLIEIGKNAFRNCICIKYIKLPKTLKIIRYDAFCNCSNLKVIFIPSSINIIEKNAFKNCNNLKYVIFY